jgi:hypothetical protein
MLANYTDLGADEVIDIADAASRFPPAAQL